MQRRQFLHGTGLSLAMLAMANSKTLANLLMQPAYKFTLLRNDVGIFTEQGGTIAWLSNNSGMAVVDT
jgi:cyclase